MSEKFKATLDGGIPLGRASNLAEAVTAAKQHIRSGKRVYIRNTTTRHCLVIRGDEWVVTNVVGAQIEPPDWTNKVRQLLSY